MHQNEGNDGAVIVSNNTKSDTCLLPEKSPTFHKTNIFCRVYCVMDDISRNIIGIKGLHFNRTADPFKFEKSSFLMDLN
jgi:hypothetical protein